jgi:solute carrier family 25 carnitine/acylcarnitine transporter 20/29
MQTETRFKGPFDCLMQTIRREGFIALYKGATPPLLGWTIMDATQWFALTNFRHILQKYLQPGEKLSVGSHALAGLGSGIVVSFVACPVEVLKAKLQVQYEGTRLYRGPFDAARSLVYI